MDSKQPKGGIILSTLCAIFFFLWGGFLIVNPAVAGDKTVCPTGCDYTSIWNAVLQANIEGGGTVTVGTPGRSTAETYSETIALLEGVNVVSAEVDETYEDYTDPWGTYSTTVLKRATLTIIDGGGGTTSVVRCPGGTPDASLDGFTIQNINGADTFLMTISDGSPTIKNNIIRNNQGSGPSGGIGLQGFGTGVPSPLIENNLIHNVHGPGVGNGPYSQATIKSNKIWDCSGAEGPGIGLLGKTSPTIEDNIIFENAQAGIGSCYHMASCPIGIEAEGGILTIPTIKGNTIHDNFAGIVLVRADGDTGTINVTIGDSDSGNIIYDSFVSGILLDGTTNATIHNNQIYNQAWAGIRLDNINDITISNNDIHHSNLMAGIIFYSNVVNATVDHNQIHENGQAGIMNRGAATLTVQNSNDIYLNSKGGINIQYTGSNNTIQGNNTIHDNLWGGIQVISAALAIVQNNYIYSNGYGGIRNVSGNSLAVTGNQIYDNGFGGIEIKYGTGTISENTIEANHYGGIGIKAPCVFEISNNIINDNLRGGIHTGEDLADGGGYTDTGADDLLTIIKNKVYGNGLSGLGGGIDVRHADGVINNNLVYKNHGGGGIRFGDYIDEIVNNTVVDNGESGSGAGIVYDDLDGAVDESPTGCAPSGIEIKNNISTDNEMAGIYVKICPDNHCPLPSERDFNLLSRNFGWDYNPTCTGGSFPENNQCKYQQLAGCDANPNEIIADPLFVNETIDDYDLLPGSPAIGTGELGVDMGAYGGSDPITP